MRVGSYFENLRFDDGAVVIAQMIKKKKKDMQQLLDCEVTESAEMTINECTESRNDDYIK